MFLKFPISVSICDPEEREQAELLNIKPVEVQEVRSAYVNPSSIESFYPSYISHNGEKVETVNIQMESGDQFTVLCEIDAFITRLQTPIN